MRFLQGLVKYIIQFIYTFHACMCFYFISINILIPKLFYFILYYFLILYCLYIRLAGLHKLLLAISCADTIYPLDMRRQYPTYSSQLPYLDRLANTRKKATETHRLLYKVYRRPFQANCTRWLLLLLLMVVLVVHGIVCHATERAMRLSRHLSNQQSKHVGQGFVFSA